MVDLLWNLNSFSGFLGLAVLVPGGCSLSIENGRIWENWELSDTLGWVMFAKPIFCASYCHSMFIRDRLNA